jgi:asparagine synthase (glutamine-hydrolysing)
MDYRAAGGSAIWMEGPVGLLQLGSTVADPPPRQQGLGVAHGERLVLVFAGHIDNPEELKAALPEAGRDADDAALALRAVETWGDAATNRIVGPFAFAVWDRERRRLFCARDFLGMRPVYYHLSDTAFVFASDIHALFEDASVPRRVNEGMVAEFLAVAPTSPEETLHAAVFRVLPGHWLAVEASRLGTGRHWEPPSHLRDFPSEADAAEQLRTEFTRATRSCLRGHGRAAVELSGGLDSSSVVVLARRVMSHAQVETASLLFPGLPDCDERPYVDAIKDATGGPALQIPFRPLGIEPLFSWAARFHDIPQAPNGTMFFPVLRELRARDHRVILDGMGGDLWLRGTQYQYAECLRRLELRSALGLLCNQPGTLRNSLARLSRYGVGPLLPPGVRRGLGRVFLPSEESAPPVPAWIDPELLRRVDLTDRLQGRRVDRRFASPAQRQIVLAASEAWYQHDCEQFERTTASYGLDRRSPLNDRRLVDFALALPDRHRWRGTRTKLILRRAMGEDLPAAVRNREGKAEFSAVVAVEYAAPEFEVLLNRPRIESLGWTRPGEALVQLRRMRDSYRAGDPTFRRLAWGVHVLVGLEVWLRAVVRE